MPSKPLPKHKKATENKHISYILNILSNCFFSNSVQSINHTGYASRIVFILLQFLTLPLGSGPASLNDVICDNEQMTPVELTSMHLLQPFNPMGTAEITVANSTAHFCKAGVHIHIF